MAKLTAFYSRADENYFGGQYRNIEIGNTEKIADMIAEITGADLFKIEQVTPYSANYQACIAEAKKDLQAKARPKLKELPKSLDGYDEIYLGYPNYWGAMPMAVYTFLEAFDWKSKTVHPFCTHEGSGLSGTVKDIEKVCIGATVSNGLAVQGSCIDAAKPTVLSWVQAFGEVL